MAEPPRAALDAPTAARPTPRGEALAELVPALTIAAHPDPQRVGDRLLLDGLASGHAVEIARAGPEFRAVGRAYGAPLGDPFVSRQPIAFVRTRDRRIRIVAERGPPFSVDDREHTAIEVGPLVPGVGVPIAVADRIVLVLHLVDPTLQPGDDLLNMVGASSSLARLRRSIIQIADLPVSVLLRGETGTGKELVAEAIHTRGPRQAGPFVSVNLAAIPRDLAAAELFGVTRGSFTGATRDRDGYFRAARGGTLFLDELGEASLELQTTLLRVLETGELFPVGSDSPVTTDVRVLAATDADLEGQIRDGRFKAPLLHRLAGHELHLPPLRERSEDLGPLFFHFARQELAAIGEAARLAPAEPLAEPWLPPAIMLRLLRYRWPGNVRELRNVTRQLVIGSRGQPRLTIEPRLAHKLEADAIRAPWVGADGTPRDNARPPAPPAAPRRRAADLTEAEVIAALRASAWEFKGAADHLGIPRPSIYDVIKRCPNVRTAGDLSAEEIERSHRDCDGDLDRMAAQLEVSRRALGRRVKELGLPIRRG
jgi:two-component system, NtrC family, nitrogen regulation response regulator GlnG